MFMFIMDNFCVFELIVSFKVDVYVWFLSWIIFNDLCESGNLFYVFVGVILLIIIILVVILMMFVLVCIWCDFICKVY